MDTWEDLFDRAARYDVALEDVRRALADRRDRDDPEGTGA